MLGGIVVLVFEFLVRELVVVVGFVKGLVGICVHVSVVVRCSVTGCPGLVICVRCGLVSRVDDFGHGVIKVLWFHWRSVGWAALFSMRGLFHWRCLVARQGLRGH